MAEQPARLQELAQLLRGAHHLGAEERGELAELLEELNQALAPAGLPEATRQHVEDNAGHLIQALHGQAQEGLLASARKRLEEMPCDSKRKHRRRPASFGG